MRSLLIFVVLALSACGGRSLTPAERAFTDTVMGPALVTDDVRLVKGAVVGLIPVTVNPRPQTSCRERLYPPITEPVEATYPAFARRETVYYTRAFWSDDFLAGYPQALDLDQAMRLAHELTHVWQWQERAKTGYHPFSAVLEHVRSADPYLVEIDETRAFGDYGWEQQGAIVEEFVCCRALDPNGARTAQLTSLVRQVFPAAMARDTARPNAIRLPWEGAELQGICS
ncbi:MAG: hypothetical protein AAGB18_06935 [Pseudomonadota bacterium]